MPDDRPTDLLGALPRTRPHRRSDKRPRREAALQATQSTQPKPAKRPARASAKRLRQPAQPPGTPPVVPDRRPAPGTGVDVVGTAVQAAADLAEIGLILSARALRNALSRLPRP